MICGGVPEPFERAGQPTGHGPQTAAQRGRHRNLMHGSAFDIGQKADQMARRQGDVGFTAHRRDHARHRQLRVARRDMQQRRILEPRHRRVFGRIGDFQHETPRGRRHPPVQIAFRGQTAQIPLKPPMGLKKGAALALGQVGRGGIEDRAKRVFGGHGATEQENAPGGKAGGDMACRG